MNETMPPPPPPLGSTAPPPPAGPPAGPPPPAGRPGLPFENPSVSFADGFVETVRLLVTRPREAFRMMDPEGDLMRPLLYAVILGWIGIVASQLYNLVFRGAMLRMMANQFHGASFGGSMGMAVGMIVVGPILVIIGLFIWSGLVHLALMLVGGANRSFTATVKVLAYAQTSALAQVVPFCGGLIAGIWGIVLQIFGIAAAHETTEGKAAAAVLLPLVFCCTCIILLMLVFGVGLAGLIGLANQG